MYNTESKDIFEGLLSATFKEYVKAEKETLPSSEELSKMYPYTKPEKRWLKGQLIKMEYKKPPYLVYLARAAVILLCIISLAVTAMLTDSDVRAAIYDSVIIWFDDHTEIDFTNQESSGDTRAETESSEPAKSFADLTVGYIPEGYIPEESQEADMHRQYYYYNGKDNYLIISIATPDGMHISVDNEHSEYEKMTINGNDAHVFYNYTERSGSVVAGNRNYIIAVFGNLDRDDLIKIAKNIK